LPAYLTIPEFKLRTVLAVAAIDRVEARHPGWLAAQFESSSRWIDMRLAKRTRVPLRGPPFPEIVQSWVARMVTCSASLSHGIQASDQQLALVIADKDKAEAEVIEAANGQISLIDIPEDDELGGSSISQGGPRFYSETSPYVSLDIQRERGRADDYRRRGS
jgi:hypothetical protein